MARSTDWSKMGWKADSQHPLLVLVQSDSDVCTGQTRRVAKTT